MFYVMLTMRLDAMKLDVQVNDLTENWCVETNQGVE